MFRDDDLLLVSSDPATVDSVSTTLGLNGQLQRNCLTRDVHELAQRLRSSPAKVALVDLGHTPMQILADLDPIVSRFPHTRFVVLSQTMESDLMLEAMQIGARHFLAKCLIPVELAHVLDRLLANGQARRGGDKGKIVTVLSASGGCGATTIAVNLANEMALKRRGTALIIDLDWCYGAVSDSLGVETQYGVADVLAAADRIDEQLISSTAAEHSEQLQVLAGPSTHPMSTTPAPAYEHMDRALDVCSGVYASTVIDAPRVPQDIAAALADMSAAVVIVFQLTVKDLRMVKQLTSNLSDAGVDRQKLILLANRFRRRGPLVPIAEARLVINDLPLRFVRSDFASTIRAANFGQPLAQAAPRSVARRDVMELADHLMNGASAASATDASIEGQA